MKVINTNKKYENIKNKNGITLIALIITIVILIILAGIAIGTMQNYKIFDRAKHERKDYQDGQNDEANKLNEYDAAIEEVTGGTTKKKEITIIDSTGKEVSITDNYAQELYGKVVDYQPSTDQQGVYRIFYYDKIGKFSNGTPTWYLKRDWEANNIRMIFQNPEGNTLEMMKQMNPEWAKNRGTATTFYDNEKVVAWLCDTTKWTKYLDEAKANFVIGAPSAELYCASYNETHKSSIDGVDYLAVYYSNKGYGYKVNGTIQNRGCYTNDNTLDITGYGSMYYRKCDWLLASPSLAGTGYLCCLSGTYVCLNCGGSGSPYGVCPLASLKSDVQIKLK